MRSISGVPGRRCVRERYLKSSGSTFLAGSYECQLPNGGESDAFPDVDPEESGWINNNGVLTTAPYYVSVVTIHYTSYYSTYDYDIERPFLTSEVEDDTTTLSIATTDSAAASSYISSSSSYLVSYYSSYYAYESSSLSRQGLAPASFITLGSASSTPAPTGAAAATGNGTASSSSSSSSSSTSSAKSTTKSSSSTSAATASTTPGAGNNSSASASPTAVPKNAASSARASGFETLIASGLTIMAIGSGLSAFLL
ncbi:hypothetical protein ANO11243_033020 [Dothideomycetidae sp. 11243]|nr:hypothetical protein ANO11243_033020 [fungal sp. No.11243]